MSNFRIRPISRRTKEIQRLFQPKTPLVRPADIDDAKKIGLTQERKDSVGGQERCRGFPSVKLALIEKTIGIPHTLLCQESAVQPLEG
jgi:hypothetical protein